MALVHPLSGLLNPPTCHRRRRVPSSSLDATRPSPERLRSVIRYLRRRGVKLTRQVAKPVVLGGGGGGGLRAVFKHLSRGKVASRRRGAGF